MCLTWPSNAKCFHQNYSSALNNEITVHHLAAKRDNTEFQFDLNCALEKTDIIARRYQFFIGGQNTLPQLMLNNLRKHNKYNKHFHLKAGKHYTGKMIVSLTEEAVRIETDDLEIVAEESSLYPHEKTVSSLLERLTNYGNNRNVQMLQLIDLNLLASRGAYEERKVFETLKERYDEHMEYDRSMIVYDLDSLIGVNRSESNSSMGISRNCSLVNQGVYNQVVARFREAQVNPTREKWAVAIVRDSFLLKMFVKDVDFPRTKKQQEEEDNEQRRDTEILRCWKCDSTYVESENKTSACDYHDGFVYDNSEPNVPIYSLSAAYHILLDEEYKDPDIDDDSDELGENETAYAREKLERAKGRFR